MNVSKLEWFISGIKDLSESREGTKFITLSLTPQTTAWNGTSVTCRATTHDGDVYEESVDLTVKGTMPIHKKMIVHTCIPRTGVKSQVLVVSSIFTKYNGFRHY